MRAAERESHSCMVRIPTAKECRAMEDQNPEPRETLEMCLEEIDEIIWSLDRFPPTIVAAALRIHLESALRAALECGSCSRPEVREFVAELAEGVLEDV